MSEQIGLEHLQNFVDMHGKFDSRWLEFHPDAVLVIDPYKDRVLYMNHQASKLLQYSSQQLEKLGVSTIFRDSLPELVVFTESVLINQHAWSNEISCIDSHHHSIKLEITASSLEIDDQVNLVFNMRSLDVESENRTRADANDLVRRGLVEWQHVNQLFREMERDNHLILGAAGEGIYGIDAQGATTFMNPAAERILGWSADELIGKNIHKLIHHTHANGKHYHETDCPIYQAFRDGLVHNVVDEVFWNKQGKPVPVEYTSTPIVDNEQLMGAVVVFRDITERKEAESRLHKALNEVENLKKKLELENAYLQEEIRQEHNYRQIVGRSKAIQKIIQQIELVAPTNANVLVTGESGTGKELIARAIHEISSRCNRPLIRVNCAAIPRELFESEFFGHIKGAFTGAIKERAGRFELADGGTLFLDEIGEIPLELQGKLLRVLQEGQFERVGEGKTRKVNVRVIAATNRNLADDVENGKFRGDLYFRLNVFPIESVALRKRKEDIPLLATHFLHRSCKRFGTKPLQLSKGDVIRLQNYNWPGNVRELENVIERATIVSKTGKLILDLPQRNGNETIEHDVNVVSTTEPGIITEKDRQSRDRKMIINALKATHGKVFGAGGAAELLDIKPTTLASRIKKLGIDKNDYK